MVVGCSNVRLGGGINPQRHGRRLVQTPGTSPSACPIQGGPLRPADKHAGRRLQGGRESRPQRRSETGSEGRTWGTILPASSTRQGAFTRAREGPPPPTPRATHDCLPSPTLRHRAAAVPFHFVPLPLDRATPHNQDPAPQPLLVLKCHDGRDHWGGRNTAPEGPRLGRCTTPDSGSGPGPHVTAILGASVGILSAVMSYPIL